MSAASVRAQLVASRDAEPDTITLFGAILESANDLRAAGSTVYLDRLSGKRPDDRTLATARAAAERAIAAIDEYEAAR